MYCTEVIMEKQCLQQHSHRHTCDLRFMAADVKFLGSQCAQIDLSAVQLWCGLQLLQGGSAARREMLGASCAWSCLQQDSDVTLPLAEVPSVNLGTTLLSKHEV